MRALLEELFQFNKKNITRIYDSLEEVLRVNQGYQIYMVQLYFQKKNISKDTTFKLVDREISPSNKWQFY